MNKPYWLPLLGTFTLALSISGGILKAADESEPGTEAPAKPVYTVATYDPKRSASDDLKTTVTKAGADGRRILLQVGGDWCGWCHLMNDYFHKNGKVAAALAGDFLIMKVNMSPENRNEAFLSKYPRAEGYPHIYVLDSDGKLLHSQGTAVLEEGKGYNESAVLKFLEKWAPKKAD